MFKELLLSSDDFNIPLTKSISADSSCWIHPNNLFKITRHKCQWSAELMSGGKSILGGAVYNDIYLSLKQHFPTLFQARNHILQLVEPYLNTDEYKVWILKLKRQKYNVCHDIITLKYPYCSGDSPLYIQGGSQNWRLGVDLDRHPCFNQTFSQTFKTRKQAVNSITKIIETNLDSLYFSTTPEKYLKDKAALMQIQVLKFIDEEINENWWIMFTKPEIDLTKIFV